MNKTIITGNLGSPAEVRTLDSGTIVIAFSVGVSESYTNKQGERVTNTTWFNCSKWVQAGQSTKIAEYLTTGTKVLVEGKVSARGYMKGDNTVGASLELNVREIELLSQKSDNNSTTQNNQNNPSQPTPTQNRYETSGLPNYASYLGSGQEEDDDTLPF